jgi:hypothetical protein
MSRRNPDTLSALHDAVAGHHGAEGIEECVGILLNRGAAPFYADDAIRERSERASAGPAGAKRTARLGSR